MPTRDIIWAGVELTLSPRLIVLLDDIVGTPAFRCLEIMGERIKNLVINHIIHETIHSLIKI